MSLSQSRLVLLAGLMAVLAACAPEPGPPPTSRDSQLTGSIWRVEDINREGIMDYAFLTMDFNTDGRIYGDAGCNTYGGSYKLSSNGGIIFGKLEVTEKLCQAEALMLQEQRFLDALSSADHYEYNEFGALVLMGPEGKSVLALPVD